MLNAFKSPLKLSTLYSREQPSKSLYSYDDQTYLTSGIANFTTG